jgi:hypothetical protein
MADPLDPLNNLRLPYDYSTGNAQPTAQPSVTVQPQSPLPSHPDLDKIVVPYKPEEAGGTATVQTPTTPTTPTTPGSWSDYLRVGGNEAFVPNTLDRVLATVSGTDFATQHAKTVQAEQNMGLPAALAAKTAGQYAQAARLVPYAGSNPAFVGAVSGAGREMMAGDFSPFDIAKQAAVEAGLSYGGAAAGKYFSGGVKALTDKNPEDLLDAATRAAQSALNRGDIAAYTKSIRDMAGITNLKNLSDAGSGAAALAKQYASSATGAAKDAYQGIVNAANPSGVVPKLAKQAASGALAYGTHWLSGSLPAAYTAYQMGKTGLDWAGSTIRNSNVQHAIDSAYPAVSSYVKTAVNPENYGQFGGALARSAAGDLDTIYSNAIKPAIDKLKTVPLRSFY